jgi:hypothetical protein
MPQECRLQFLHVRRVSALPNLRKSSPALDLRLNHNTRCHYRLVRLRPREGQWTPCEANLQVPNCVQAFLHGPCSYRPLSFRVSSRARYLEGSLRGYKGVQGQRAGVHSREHSQKMDWRNFLKVLVVAGTLLIGCCQASRPDPHPTEQNDVQALVHKTKDAGYKNTAPLIGILTQPCSDCPGK